MAISHPAFVVAFIARDAAVGHLLHVLCGELANTHLFRHRLGPHLGDGRVSNFGLRLHALRTLPGSAQLLASVGLRHGQRHHVRVVFVQLRVLLQRLIWQLGQRGRDLVDVDSCHDASLCHVGNCQIGQTGAHATAPGKRAQPAQAKRCGAQTHCL